MGVYRYMAVVSCLYFAALFLGTGLFWSAEDRLVTALVMLGLSLLLGSVGTLRALQFAPTGYRNSLQFPTFVHASTILVILIGGLFI